MEEKKEQLGLLDMILRPAFSVKENRIETVNSAAQALLILPGTDVRPLLLTGQDAYEAFDGGCLYLKLNLSAKGCGASVVRQEDCDVFVLDQESDDAELRCLALAARELREPLTSVMISADRLIASNSTSEHTARLNRGLHQMLRIIGNMSDAGRSTLSSQQETRNLSSLFSEIFEKAQGLLAHSSIHLTYQGLSEDVFSLADGEQLERAILNILSNAVKFTPKGGTIQVQLTRRERILRLSITDSGSGMAETVRSTIFHRYLRQPGIEDGRCGIGLGMVLIRSAAANHGGAVLIDQPAGMGTRITLTMAIRHSTDTVLRSPILRVDYAGEREHGLIELAECLPVSVYEKE